MANIGKEVHQGVEFELRSTPLPQLTLECELQLPESQHHYDFGSLATVSAVNTSITILPTLPKNKFVGTVTYRLPHQILAILNERYESGLTLQDTTYATTSPLFLPYSESYATTDLFGVVPIRAGVTRPSGREEPARPELLLHSRLS